MVPSAAAFFFSGAGFCTLVVCRALGGGFRLKRSPHSTREASARRLYKSSCQCRSSRQNDEVSMLFLYLAEGGSVAALYLRRASPSHCSAAEGVELDYC